MNLLTEHVGTICGLILVIIIFKKDSLVIIRTVMGKETNVRTDERTEKVAGKAAMITIIVIMVAIAIIYFGDVFNLNLPNYFWLACCLLAQCEFQHIGFL